ITLRYQIRSMQPTQAGISWSVEYNDQVIARRSGHFSTKVGEPSELKLNLRLPELPSATPRKLTVNIAVDSDEVHRRAIWVFATDPFQHQRERLRRLDIQLFDPAERTAEQFEKWRIPFRNVSRRSDLKRVNSGLFILGAGFSPRKQRNLEVVMAGLISRGVDVMSLEPADGQLPILDTENSVWPVPSQLAFHRSKIIRHFDKRLDSESWPPDGQIVNATLQLATTRTGMVGQVSDAERGWPWLDVRFAEDEGRFLFCGFGIIRHATSTPAASQLLREILISFEEPHVE
ncbi:MAG: hypothetical protein ACOC7K_00235, partial [bacterium]